jgi:hypothetical protein
VSALATVGLAQKSSKAKESQTASSESKAAGAPTMEANEAPSSDVPEQPAEEALEAQPLNLVYVGPEGSFLLSGPRSRGIFRWNSHWATSISYAFEDNSYYVYRMTGSNGWFAFAKNGSGGQYLVWKGLTSGSNIQWQNTPNGWMHATRGPATGNQQ